MKSNIFTILLTTFTINLFGQNQLFEWAKSIGGDYNCTSSCITTDNQGNTYISGEFTGIVDFDPGVGIYSLNSNGISNVFICKFNSYGSLIWAKRFGSFGTFVNDITVDNLGNIFTTGFFEGSGDFDPGAPILNFQSNGNQDCFISKIDSTGNLVWAKQIGADHKQIGRSITRDNSNNIYVSGDFNDNVDFDPNVGIYFLAPSNNQDGVFILKLDDLGNFIWAKKIEGQYIYPTRIRCDNNNNILITGKFHGGVDFDPGPDATTLNGYFTTFICKLNLSGGFIWAKEIAGESTCYGISIDVNNNIYLTGTFIGIGDFNPSDSVVYNLVSQGGGNDAFVCKLYSTGGFGWAKVLGGYGLDVGTGITLDGSGNVYTCGYFTGTSDFDPGPLIYNFQTIGIPNSFISCLNSNGNFVWANVMAENPINTPTPELYCTGIALDSYNNLFTAGYFSGLWDFNQGTLISNLYNSANYSGYTSYINKMSYPKILNLKLFLQGYYTGSNHMTEVLFNQGVGTSYSITDSITVELHGSSSPFQLITSVKSILNNDGTAFSSLQVSEGSYYIVVKHRNGIETWSANPIQFLSTAVTYDFTTASSKAYGNNMVQLQPNIWAFYTGDINGDENIDLLDLSSLETDINYFQYGYYKTDLNGDGNVDLLDTPILETNVNNFVFSNHP